MNRTTILEALSKEIIQGFKDLEILIHNSQGIIISAHFSPDGDNIGSSLAFYEYIKSLNKKVVLINEDPVPDYLRFLDPNNILKTVETCNTDLSQMDTCIILDSGDLHRIGKVQDLIKGKYLVNIDHHKSNTSFAELNILDISACATAEVVYNYLLFHNYEITRNMAYCLFTGIATDTGFFRFQSMHKEVYLIAADLMEKGVNPSLINQHIYQSRKSGFLKLLGRALESIEWYCDNKIAIASLGLEDFKAADTQDTEGIVNQIGIVESVEVFVLIREKQPGLISASLRSKKYVDVSDAVSVLGGGGHARAAGCRTKELELNDFKKEIVKQLKKYI